VRTGETELTCDAAPSNASTLRGGGGGSPLSQQTLVERCMDLCAAQLSRLNRA
jgi:hypothetical protein